MTSVQYLRVTPRESLSLDPVELFLVDYEPGKGSVTATCYGSAWTAWFGGMGDFGIVDFLAGSDSYCLAFKFESEITKNGKRDYYQRVAQAVIEECKKRARKDGGE